MENWYFSGTIAVLKPSVNIFNKDGSDASTDKNPILEATNHLVCVHNLSLNDEHQRPAYMVWPKRTVSWIDFIGDRRCDRGMNLVIMPVILIWRTMHMFVL